MRPQRGPAFGQEEFLERYPDFAVRPQAGDSVRLVGRLERVFTADGLPDLPDVFQLEILITARFPRIPPRVFETGGRIPGDYHKLEGALCLSSPLRVALAVGTKPSLLPFFDDLVIPYLYRYAHCEKFKKDPWPDIGHDASDLIDDYVGLLEASTDKMCLGYLELLGMKRGIANKKPCPCGSGVGVARCQRHHRELNTLRGKLKAIPRSAFRAEHAVLQRALDRSSGIHANGGAQADHGRPPKQLTRARRSTPPDNSGEVGQVDPSRRSRAA